MLIGLLVQAGRLQPRLRAAISERHGRPAHLERPGGGHLAAADFCRRTSLASRRYAGASSFPIRNKTQIASLDAKFRALAGQRRTFAAGDSAGLGLGGCAPPGLAAGLVEQRDGKARVRRYSQSDLRPYGPEGINPETRA